MIQFTHKQLLLTKFIGLYLVAIVLLVVIFMALTSGVPKAGGYATESDSDPSATTQKFMDLDLSLRKDFLALELQDALYEDNILSNGSQDALLNINVERRKLETIVFEKLNQMKELDPEADPILLSGQQSAVDFFSALLENRRMTLTANAARIPLNATQKDRKIAELQASITDRDKRIQELAKSGQSVTDSRETDRLNQLLAAKNQQIAGLNRQKNEELASLAKTKDAQIANLKKAQPVPALTRGSVDAAELEELKKRNENLLKGFNSMATQVGMLTKSNNQLKKENQALASRVSSLSQD